MPAASRQRSRRARIAAVLALAAAALSCAPAEAARPRFSIPASALQLVVVSSPTYDPPEYLATLRAYRRASAVSPWEPIFPAWKAEIGSGELTDARREGDHATPTGVYGFGATVYGNEQDPGGLHEPFHHLVCGDWWDEDPFSSTYNEFVHVACGSAPPFESWSEALWTEEPAYPYFAVIDYNEHPTISGALAPGSGIFLHAWVQGPTEGCVALPVPELLHVLRWLEPADHPVIEIGTVAELGRVPPLPAGAR